MPGNIVNISPADIAKWPTPNYDHPKTRNWMPPYAGLLYGITVLMVFTRLWLRWRKKQAGGLGLDDALLFSAWLGTTWLTTTGLAGTEMYMVKRRMWDVPPTVYEDIARMMFIAELAFLFASCCVKVSVLLFYRRLMVVYSKYWLWAVWAAIVFTVAYTMAFVLALLLNCSPTEAYWKAFNPNYDKKYFCAKTTINNILSGVLAAVSDLYAVALPMIMTRNFTMPPGQKLALNIVFSFGFLVVAASIVRTYWVYEIGRGSDITTYIFNALTWSLVEIDLAIICISAPAMRSLLRDSLNGPLSRVRTSSSPDSGPRQVAYTENSMASSKSGHLELRHGPDSRHIDRQYCTENPSVDLELGSTSTRSLDDHLCLVRTFSSSQATDLQSTQSYHSSLQSFQRLDDRGQYQAEEPEHLRGQSWSHLRPSSRD